MKTKENQIAKTIGHGIIRFQFLPSGNIKQIIDDTDYVRINTYVGNDYEAMIHNIYLLIDDNGNKSYTRLIGVNSPSKYQFKDDGIIYLGEYQGIKYLVNLTIFDDLFTYQVKLNKAKDGLKIKLFIGIDISIGDIGGISANEAYISQYIDHKGIKDELGYTICSRQNQGRHNYFELGSLNKTVGFSTDGFQFFGKDYKFNYVPKAIIDEKLENEVYQYEFSYPALETAWENLNEEKEFIFYGGFMKEHNEAVTKCHFKEKVEGLNLSWPKLNDEWCEYKPCLDFDEIYPFYSLTKEELDAIYPKDNRLFLEKNQNILSFFLPNKAHVVRSEKEHLLERPSGNIIVSLEQKDGLYDLEKIFASTHYIYGLFNSQIVYGNTSFNKLLTNNRNPLNLQKVTGQRIFIKQNDKYQLLALPAAYEMGLNYAKWYYKIADDFLIVETDVALDTSEIKLRISSKNHQVYDLLISNQVVMQQTEDDGSIIYENNGDLIRFDFNEYSLTKARYPEYYFTVKTNYDEFKVLGNNLFVFKYQKSEVEMLIKGCDETCVQEPFAFDNNRDNYLLTFKSLLCDLNISSKDEYLDSYNILCYWFLHDGLIHYLSPHGLEQYNGAAWGTRDVSQGSFELFKAFNNFKEIKRIISKVFSHQFLDIHTFPQWFMFDRYINICDTGSHGDVILWPLRMVGMYLRQTNDYEILNEEIPYLDRTIMNYNGSDTLLNHIKMAIKSIEDNFIPGTYLSCYGGGDWDDTLQPAKSEYKEKMASGWTVELTYEIFNLLRDVLKEVDSSFSNKLGTLAKNIKTDFEKYIMKDGIPAGFLYFGDELNYIIHPLDHTTNLKYRLLPLLRGGISGMFTKDEALKYNALIEKEMLYPDGVRLMNQPIKYKGGINEHFQRAETSANFGREIGMQYCHAHIRYCELLQKLGLKEKFYHEFLKINPIIIKDVVKNAMTRQRNSYFSSSDAFFYNRYLVESGFDLLKKGEVLVKGGWRIYSSGSGIYLHNLITGMLGLEMWQGMLSMRPQTKEDGLIYQFNFLGKTLTIKCYQGKPNLLINKKKANYQLINDRFIILDELKDQDIIEITC